MLLFQNHFDGNWMKKFRSKNFLVDNFSGRKYFCWIIVFSEIVWMIKIWSKNFLVENLFVAKSFPRKKFGWQKFWSTNFLVEIFFFLQNHLLGNSLPRPGDRRNFDTLQDLQKTSTNWRKSYRTTWMERRWSLKIKVISIMIVMV